MLQNQPSVSSSTIFLTPQDGAQRKNSKGTGDSISYQLSKEPKEFLLKVGTICAVIF